MIKLYNRLLIGCESINMRNRTLIKLENWMTPIQFTTLKHELKIKQSFNDDNKQWIEKFEFFFVIRNRIFIKLEKLMAPLTFKIFKNKQSISKYNDEKWLKKLEFLFSNTNKTTAENFIKKRIDRYTILFTSNNQDIASKEKTLLVCMTGAAGRMMMPLPVFLQYNDARSTDIIYFTYPTIRKGYGYRQGMPGYDKTFEEMLERLAFLPFNEYQRVVGMGVSGGALPILLLALKYHFDAVMSIGTNGPNDARWIEATSGRIKELIQNLEESAKEQTSIYLIYGADSQKDKTSAEQLKTLLSKANLIKIEDKNEKVGHGALKPLIKNGLFSQLLSNTIFKK